jgi:hypothetical protein
MTTRSLHKILLVALAAAGALFSPPTTAAEPSVKLRLTWGHRSPAPRPFLVNLRSNNTAIAGLNAFEVETGESFREGVLETRAGGGDVDGITAEVSWKQPGGTSRKPHEIWAYLLQHGTPDQIARLRDDPGLMPDAPVLTVVMSADGTQGFSLGLEQLVRHRAMWLPERDVYVTLADAPVDFAAHVAGLKGERVLDRVQREPEAALADFTSRWEDIGNPNQWNVSWQTRWLGTLGHLTGTVARHGSLYKFGVDRWGGVRPDYASPHKFRFDPLWPECKWVGQRITNGLPILVTQFERSGQRCEIEQFAAPLRDAPPAKRGEVSSVFLTRVRFEGEPGPIRFGFRLATENTNRHPELRRVADRSCVVDRETGAVWLMLEPGSGLVLNEPAIIADAGDPRLEVECAGRLNTGEPRDIVLKLMSPTLAADAAGELAALSYTAARSSIVQYWEEWLARGARFEVPEREVNDLFRANLWHALMLPRHRADDQGVGRIDLPYSNFAYGQYNSDWPINQAVYVDYMIYGLRGHFGVAEEEFAAMYHTQQKPDGRIGGYAEWGVYSPGMIYSVGRNFLLSGDRSSFERLLPASLKAADWCLGEVSRGQTSKDAPGLIVAPLNDLTHDSRAWGFPNAYFVAGLEVFGRALAAYGHPRAGEFGKVAARMRADVEREFARGSVRSPAVQLADGTWINYVPCDAMTPRRLLDAWYPTDVDCGALHLSRLSAIDPRGWLTTALLHDHEDNLFLNQWGMANEPVYNQQATAYLLRDEPVPAVRAFYSMMACAFSHHQLTPLEHRWAWGQYYMPPSTDGAWFDLFRHMLIHERDDGSLLLGQATPRQWLEHGNQIRIERAPTVYGPLDMVIESRASAGEIAANLDLAWRTTPESILVRLRHPRKRPIKSVLVNGENWSDFDAAREWVRISKPGRARYSITARF